MRGRRATVGKLHFYPPMVAGASRRCTFATGDANTPPIPPASPGARSTRTAPVGKGLEPPRVVESGQAPSGSSQPGPFCGGGHARRFA